MEEFVEDFFEKIIICCFVFEVISTHAYYTQRPAHELSKIFGWKELENILVPRWVNIFAGLNYLFNIFYIYLCFIGHYGIGLVFLLSGVISDKLIKTPTKYYHKTLERIYKISDYALSAGLSEAGGTFEESYVPPIAELSVELDKVAHFLEDQLGIDYSVKDK